MARMAPARVEGQGTSTVTVTMPQAPPPLPAKPEEKEQRPDFWAYMASLSPKEWEEHIVYLTREEPKTGIRGVGGYLCKLTQAFDIEDIKNAYGGTRFSYIMKKKNDIAYKGDFRVEAPPKFDANREIAESATNGGQSNGAAQSNGANSEIVREIMAMLREDLAKARDELRAAVQNPASSQAMDLLTDAYKRGTAVLQEQIPKQSGLHEIVATVGELQRMAQPAAQPAASQGMGFLDMIRALKELGLLALPGAVATAVGGTTSLLAQIKELKEASEFFSGGGEKGWKEMLMDRAPEVIEKVGEIFKSAAQTAGERTKQVEIVARAQAAQTQRAALAAGGIQTNGQVTQSTPTPQTAGTPQNDRPAPAGVAANDPIRTVPIGGDGAAIPGNPQGTAGGGVGVTVPAGSQDAPEVQNLKIRVVELIHKGVPGAAVVDGINFVAPKVVDYFMQMVLNGEEGELRKHFAGDPILQQAMNAPKFERILVEIEDYLQEFAEPAEDDATEPAVN